MNFKFLAMIICLMVAAVVMVRKSSVHAKSVGSVKQNLTLTPLANRTRTQPGFDNKDSCMLSGVLGDGKPYKYFMYKDEVEWMIKNDKMVKPPENSTEKGIFIECTNYGKFDAFTQ